MLEEALVVTGPAVALDGGLALLLVPVVAETGATGVVVVVVTMVVSEDAVLYGAGGGGGGALAEVVGTGAVSDCELNAIGKP